MTERHRCSWPVAAIAAAALAATPAAIATTMFPAVAYADEGSTPSGDNSSSSDSASDSSSDTSTESESPASEPGDTPETEPDSEGIEEIENEDEVEDEEVDDQPAAEDEVEDDAEEDAEQQDDAETGEDVADEPKPESDSVDETTSTSRRTEVFEAQVAEPEAGAAVAEAPAALADESGVDPAPQVEIAAPLLASTQEVAAAVDTSTTAVDVVLAVPRAVFSFTTKVVATALLPLLSDVPTDIPASQSPLLAVLGWVRREFEYIALDLAPTSTPRQMIQDDDGNRVILGTLVAQGVHNDPETNRVPLEFRIVDQPDFGDATIDDLGNYTYTPHALIAENGGTDSFQVEIIDNGTHLDDLLGIEGHSTIVTVPVTVTATPSAETQTVDDPEDAQTNYMAAAAEPTFHIYNLSQYDVVVLYVGTTDPGDAFDDLPTDGRPAFATGDVIGITPGDSEEPVYVVLKTVENEQVYHVTVFDGYDLGYSYQEAACSASGNGASCTPQWVNGDGFYDSGAEMTVTDNVILLDAPGTTVTIPSSDPDEQNSTLDNLCDDDNVKCDWDSSSRTFFLAEGVLPDNFQPVHNNTDAASTSSITVSNAVATAHSWTVSDNVQVKLGPVATESITGTYGETVTDTTTFSQQITITVEPGDTGYIYFQAPMYRYYGDFVITGGNTTWYVEDVYVDAADGDDTGLYTTSDSATPPPSTL